MNDSDNRCCRWILVTLTLGLLAGGPAAAQVPEATPVVERSYTVTYATDCAALGGYCMAVLLQEKAGSSGAWTTISSGSGSISFEGKADGTYSYRLYMSGLDPWGNYAEYLSPELTVAVAPESLRDDILTQMQYQFEVRRGDIDGNGKQDLFVRRTAGGVSGNGVVDKLILRQGVSGGTFSALVPTAQQASIGASWPRAPVEVVVHDMNIDGYVDLALNGVAAVAANAPDQIVLSSGQPTIEQPIGIRAYDEETAQFADNVLSYFVDRDYFIDNAEQHYFETWIWYAYCPSFDFVGLDQSYWDIFSYCYVDIAYISGIYADFSVFNEKAVAIWANEQDGINGYQSPEQALDNIEAAVEGALATPIGGWPMEELLGSEGIHSDAEFRRNIELVQSILGQIRGRNAGANPNAVPPQQPRQPDRIYYTGHHLFLWDNHMALEYTDSSSGAPMTTTISGFPERGLFPPHGKLWADLDRLSDQPHLNFTVGTLDVLNGMTPRGYWNSYLLPRHHRYVALPNASKLDYEPTPSPANLNPGAIHGYNSNSYVAGLPYAGAFKNVPAATWFTFPGWNEPVPNQYFQ